MDNHFDRRAFVETLLALPVGLFLVRCGSSTSSSSGASEPGAQPTVTGGQAVYTSSVVQAHSHTFGIDLTAFSNPPSGGVNGSTSLNQAHIHRVSISMDQLASVQVGRSVIVTTSTDSGHNHAFMFVRVAGPTGDGGLVKP
jgi:hypothetical protein